MKRFLCLFLVFLLSVSFVFSDIILVGETHGIENIYNEELNLYRDFYKKGGRHFFVELGYNTAQLLNFWMNREDDELLRIVHSNWQGTYAATESYFNFFIALKREFPETVFHGIDVEHQYKTNGLMYLNYLERNGLQDSPKHKMALLSQEQGQKYYKKNSDSYREKCLTENFIREYTALGDKDVFGVFGSSHTSKTIKMPGYFPTMGMNLIRAGYDYSEFNLSGLAWVQTPYEMVRIRIDGEVFDAGFYGAQNLRGMKDYDFREFYALSRCSIEDLNSHGRKFRKTGNYLPQSNYPMKLREDTVYIIDYYFMDGTMETEIHICDGKKKNGQMVTYQVR